MRLLMEVEARVNQADGLHKNEVRFLNFCFKYTVKPVTQPAGYTAFHYVMVRVKIEGGLY